MSDMGTGEDGEKIEFSGPFDPAQKEREMDELDLPENREFSLGREKEIVLNELN